MEEEKPQQQQEQQQQEQIQEEEQQQQQQEVSVPPLEQKKYEVNSQFVKRQQVYQNVFKDLKNINKAVCYSNIYANIVFLGNTYSDEITKKVMQYAPATEE